MKVTTVAFNRFHIFDQARELQNLGLLHKLISNYPRYKTREFGILDENVISLIQTGLMERLRLKISGYIPSHHDNSFSKWLHNKFSKEVQNYIDIETDIAIFLSSFGLEGIEYCNNNNIKAISDHGSAHIRYEQNILSQEREIFGLGYGLKNIDWLIEKQDCEFSKADYILLGSSYAKDTFLMQGYDSDKLIINNYGVNIDGFKKIEKTDDVFRVITVASPEIRKGIHYLIKAFNDLGLKDSELWIVGNKDISEDLAVIFKKMKLNFENIYFKGMFRQKDLYKVYSQCSVFCLPSLSDGFGMVVPQALSCGLPAIVSSNTGSKDIIIDSSNGYIVPIRNSEAIKDKLLFLYENQYVLAEMSVVACESVKRGLSWADYGCRLKSEFQKIMEE